MMGKLGVSLLMRGQSDTGSHSKSSNVFASQKPNLYMRITDRSSS
jgi:hypothetical protein